VREVEGWAEGQLSEGGAEQASRVMSPSRAGHDLLAVCFSGMHSAAPSHACRHACRAGSELFRLDDPADALYIIERGTGAEHLHMQGMCSRASALTAAAAGH